MTLYAKLKVKPIGTEKGVFAAEDIAKGEKILDFLGRIVPEEESGEWDLSIGRNKFIRAPKNSIDNFQNHSCNPNSYVKKIGSKFYLIALKNIKKGQEITYDYDTNDYDNVKFEFVCRCNSKNCRKLIRGFKYLSDKQKKRLEKYLIPYLKKTMKTNRRKGKIYFLTGIS